MTRKLLALAIFVFLGGFIQAQSLDNRCWSIDYETWNTTGTPSLYIDCGNDEAFNGGEELTLEVWARAYTFAENRKIMGKIEYNEPIDNGYVLGFENLHVYAEYFNPSIQVVPRPGDGPMAPDSAFTHLVTTYSVSSGKIQSYVNGILSGETTMFPSTALVDNDRPFIIGNAPWDLLSYQFYGDLDEVRVWNKALSQEEIQSRMHTQLMGDETELVAYYNFNAAADSTVPDSGPNGFDGNLSHSTHESTQWMVSSAPVGDLTMSNMQDIAAAWYRSAENYHKIVTDNGLIITTLINPLEFRKYVVAGMNSEDGIATDLAPENPPADYKRSNRQWYFNCASDVSGSMTFNLEDAMVGDDFPMDDDDNQYALLYRADESKDFRAIARPTKLLSGIFIINDYEFKDGFYAIGHSSEEFPIQGFDAISDIKFSNLILAPNPVNNQLFIDGAPLNTNLSIYQISGSLVKQVKAIQNQEIIDLSDLNSGIYFLEFEIDGIKTTRKLIKN
ncbi:T9SS type A sorting domain-containing protein [Lentimicrobium sp. L6]|uniref:LamG-like jellyroll fold domain-containing protein n=1 Tax=Lentimicrobium sp. L6 TaxID=2735916 RepID=UPI001556F985|nr:LamG-like jellyroll fold domain-containing protein [Lentimicrobium sp. L6]NPD84544.1 T9SS type A sorting domain-containing protein [Lentimicrobium sp. L6]